MDSEFINFVQIKRLIINYYTLNVHLLIISNAILL